MFEQGEAMSRIQRNLIVALGLVALAVPAAAVAKQGDNNGKAKGHTKTHNVAYIFKGTYAGASSVEVKSGNSRVRKGGFVGETVAFDFATARIVVADTNGDSQRNLDDVQIGDKVLVKSQLPKSDPGAQPFVAKKLIDQTHNPG
jgi:cation transport ATPase